MVGVLQSMGNIESWSCEFYFQYWLCKQRFRDGPPSDGGRGQKKFLDFEHSYKLVTRLFHIRYIQLYVPVTYHDDLRTPSALSPSPKNLSSVKHKNCYNDIATSSILIYNTVVTRPRLWLVYYYTTVTRPRLWMVDYHTTVNRPHPRLVYYYTVVTRPRLWLVYYYTVVTRPRLWLVHHYTAVTSPSPPLTGILLYIAVSVAYLRCDIGGIVIVEYLPQGGWNIHFCQCCVHSFSSFLKILFIFWHSEFIAANTFTNTENSTANTFTNIKQPLLIRRFIYGTWPIRLRPASIKAFNSFFCL